MPRRGGCNDEEVKVAHNPQLAGNMVFGSAEADMACNRYIVSSGLVEDYLCKSVENVYMKAVNGSGVFSNACTDGQAKNEAYLYQVREGSTAFRRKQYSPYVKEHAKYQARKRATDREHVCVYEDVSSVSLHSPVVRS